MKAIEEVARLSAKIADGSMSPNEPLFVLRGQDALAVFIVREWILLASTYGTPPAKLTEAMQRAAEMDEWQPRQIPGRPDTLETTR